MDKMEDDPPKSREAAKGKDSHKGEEVFLSGVIEGFYNRPWTIDQRLVHLRNFMTYYNINT